VEAEVPTQPRRWRAFADGVATALGVNLWVTMVLLPALYAGPLRGAAALACALPLAVLVFGIFRRSELVLLLGFPAALLVPLAHRPEIANMQVYSAWRFGLLAAGLVTYLFGASVFTSFREPAPPRADRPLSSSARPAPGRWRRRFRVYAGLAVLSAVVPLVLLYAIDFDGTNQTWLRKMYSNRVAELVTVMNLAALAVWVGLYEVFFLGVLRPHRTGDRELIAELSDLRRQARRRRPRPSFYVGVVVAIGLMLLLLALRHR
jgi:hypothetical protein